MSIDSECRRRRPGRCRAPGFAQFMVGSVPVGGGAPVSVQSMATTLTADVNATLQQIAELTASAARSCRVAVRRRMTRTPCPRSPGSPDPRDSPTFTSSRSTCSPPSDAGSPAGPVNPGNIKGVDDKVGEIARGRQDAGIPIRIGVNAGSLDKRLMAKYGKATPEALWSRRCGSAPVRGARLPRHQDLGKHHDPVVMINAYRLLAQKSTTRCTGVTEAGPTFQGRSSRPWRSARCWPRASGDTIRVSLSAPPVEEVKVGIGILESLGMRQRGLEIVSCPSCGRSPGRRLQAGTR